MADQSVHLKVCHVQRLQNTQEAGSKAHSKEKLSLCFHNWWVLLVMATREREENAAPNHQMQSPLTKLTI